MSVLPSYRNQSINLLCKSIDWFLYGVNTGIYCVNWVFNDKQQRKEVNQTVSFPKKGVLDLEKVT